MGTESNMGYLNWVHNTLSDVTSYIEDLIFIYIWSLMF